jgi:HAD superfamily phosphoserine phosphatase-like hydrolase
MKTLVLFDFDGTITTKDSFPLFFKFSFGDFYYYLGFFFFTPLFVLLKLKLLDAEKLKIKILSFYLKGKSREWIEEKGKDFILYLFKNEIVKKEFITLMNEYKLKNAEIAVVSASPDAWVKIFCDNMNVVCLCTKLKYLNNIFVGKLIGPNCNGTEKKTRILKQFNLSEFSEIIAYGDSEKGDGEMMKLANVVNWIKN